jgi:hypothetical protein
MALSGLDYDKRRTTEKVFVFLKTLFSWMWHCVASCTFATVSEKFSTAEIGEAFFCETSVGLFPRTRYFQ